MVITKNLEKRTKIVATIGPALENPDTIRALIYAGVNVLRLTFSHTDPESAERMISVIHDAREELHIPIVIMADIKGRPYECMGIQLHYDQNRDSG